MEADKDQEKKRAVNVATRSLERDLERLKADHATEIEQLNERHKQEISELKRKQWVRFDSTFLRLFNHGFFVLFSVLIARLRPYTGVVGIQPTVPQCANRNIGIENINECADVGDKLAFFPRPPLTAL